MPDMFKYFKSGKRCGVFFFLSHRNGNSWNYFSSKKA